MFFLAFCLLILGYTDAFAQLTSEHAIGGRFGSAQGVTYRHTLQPDRAVEGILSVQSNSKSRRFRMVGLYQYHQPLRDDFTWYYGFGGSIGSYKQKGYTEVSSEGNSRYINPNSELALSLEGVIGVEYNIPEAPISVSLDLKPYLDFLQESSIRLIDPFGFSIRYKF